MGGRRHLRGDGGQASVEFVALVPLVLLLGWVAWQASLAGLTAARVTRAANAAARAAAIGGDATSAARRSLPSQSRRVAKVEVGRSAVRVRLAIPAVIPGLDLGSLAASGTYPAQGGADVTAR